MLKVHWKVGPKVVVEAEGATVADTFEALAHMVEVFGAQSKCGVCDSDNIRPIVREVDGNRFYELKCFNTNCRAKFAFGQHKNVKGSLFPQWSKGKGDKKAYKPNNGWEKYVPEEKKEGK